MAIITTDDLRAHLNLPDEQDEALLAAYIEAAQASVESFIGLSFKDDAEPPLKQAVRQLAASYYEDREGSQDGLARIIPMILPYREVAY